MALLKSLTFWGIFNDRNSKAYLEGKVVSTAPFPSKPFVLEKSKRSQALTAQRKASVGKKWASAVNET